MEARSGLPRLMWVLLTASAVAISGCTGLSTRERAAAADLPEAALRPLQAGGGQRGKLQLPKQSAASGGQNSGKSLAGPVRGLRATTVGSCEIGRQYALQDLAAQSLSVSYQGMSATMGMLAAMGYTVRVIGGPGQPTLPRGERYSCAELPVVMFNAVDDSKLSLSLEPRGGLQGNYISSGIPGGFEGASYPSRGAGVVQGRLNTIDRSHSANVDRMVVFYHPDHPASLSRVRKHIRRVVDVPAPQVYIEIWVLEIAEEDARELGIRYAEGLDNDETLQLGTISESGDTVDYLSDNRLDAAGNPIFIAAEGVLKRIRAVVENQKARFLSRPSVLTLSNRQAIIQVVDVIQYPLIQTTFQGLNSVTSGVAFGSLRIGITLNLRPRVSADRQWVSLEIDATVDAEDEENAGQAFGIDPDSGEKVLLSEKPGFTSRRVHTFARVPDRTPIIIGGLVSTEDSKLTRRVPWIGEIPFLGALFGYTDKDVTQREIMIVITPYVLAEKGASVRTNTPKESVTFDDTDMALFDDRYRLRREDVFDLSEITSNPRFARHQLAAKRAIQADQTLLRNPRFAAFVNGRLPGGKALVDRTFFDLARKLDLAGEIDSEAVWVSTIRQDKIISSNLEELLALPAGDEVILIGGASSRLPVGTYARVVDKDTEVPEGAIRIASPADILRLRNAVAAQELIALNGGPDNLKIRHIHAGQFIALPNFEDAQIFSMNAETLRVYRHSSAYAELVNSRLEAVYEAVERQEIDAPAARPRLSSPPVSQSPPIPPRPAPQESLPTPVPAQPEAPRFQQGGAPAESPEVVFP